MCEQHTNTVLEQRHTFLHLHWVCACHKQTLVQLTCLPCGKKNGREQDWHIKRLLNTFIVLQVPRVGACLVKLFFIVAVCVFVYAEQCISFLACVCAKKKTWNGYYAIHWRFMAKERKTFTHEKKKKTTCKFYVCKKSSVFKQGNQAKVGKKSTQTHTRMQFEKVWQEVR